MNTVLSLSVWHHFISLSLCLFSLSERCCFRSHSSIWAEMKRNRRQKQSRSLRDIWPNPCNICGHFSSGVFIVCISNFLFYIHKHIVFKLSLKHTKSAKPDTDHFSFINTQHTVLYETQQSTRKYLDIFSNTRKPQLITKHTSTHAWCFSVWSNCIHNH